jgi:hypothetical protein
MVVTMQEIYSFSSDTGEIYHVASTKTLTTSLREPHNEERDLSNYHGTTLKPQVTTTTRSSSADDFLLPRRLAAREMQRPTKQRLLAGWRAGALASFIGALSVCLFNLAITIWVWKGEGHEIVGSIGTLFRGECRRVRNLNVWIHLLVNTLSTLLLCASNYCMQILSAPNRQDIAKAHAKQTWLNIGVPSLHNLLHIHRFRSVLWVLLVFSSLPLHLLFNSVVFTNLQANEYTVTPTTEDFLHGAAYDTSGFLDFTPFARRQINFTLEDVRPNLTERVIVWDVTVGSKHVEQNRYSNVSTADCFNQYGDQYLSAVGDVYLVQDGPTIWRNTSAWHLKRNSAGTSIWERDSIEHDGYTNIDVPKSAFLVLESSPRTYPADAWRCSPYNATDCDVDNFNQIPQDRSKWAPYERPIRYCMVEQVQEVCQLQFSFIIALIVISSNLVKVFVMGLVFFKFRSHAALVTLGDVIASFLDEPDPETRGCCLITKTDVEDRWKVSRSAKKVKFTDRPTEFEPVPHRWSNAPDYGHWLLAYVFYLGAMIFGGICIGWTMAGMPKDPAKLWKIGFGTVNGNNLMKTTYPLMSGILLANTPQALLSYLYLAFNALYTNMCTLCFTLPSYILLERLAGRLTLGHISPVKAEASRSITHLPDLSTDTLVCSHGPRVGKLPQRAQIPACHIRHRPTARYVLAQCTLSLCYSHDNYFRCLPLAYIAEFFPSPDNDHRFKRTRR